MRTLFRVAPPPRALRSLPPAPTYVELMAGKGIVQNLNPSGARPTIVSPGYADGPKFFAWARKPLAGTRIPADELFVSSAAGGHSPRVARSMIIARGDWFSVHWTRYIAALVVDFMLERHVPQEQYIYAGLFDALKSKLYESGQRGGTLAKQLKT